MPFSLWAYDGWSKGTIKSVRYQASGILLQMNHAADSAINPSQCGDNPLNDATYIFLPLGSEPYYQNMHAGVLSAYLAGKSVHLAITGCVGKYPKITEVWLR